ncbi:MAG: hypothetical protein P1V51_11330 [Deltaproteobacteria bacterium]|nr:hypothetical protein [Deltaproteobacteria bacterium]
MRFRLVIVVALLSSAPLILLVAGCDALACGPAPGTVCADDGRPEPPCYVCQNGAWREQHWDPATDGGTYRPAFKTCSSSDLPPMATVDWEHPVLTGAVLLAGAPDHSAQDVIAIEDQSTTIPGKFAYGDISKDLEGEYVEVYLDDCSGQLRLIGETLTDSDGRIALSVPWNERPPVGAHRLHFRVKGDDSRTSSWLRVVPPGTKAMVADIDGTLTTSDLELFQDIFSEYFDQLGAGAYVPEARAGAIDLTLRRRVEQGYLLILVTGRPYYLTDITREWLETTGVAPAHLHVTDSNAEAVPSDTGVGAFKADYLNGLKAMGLDLVAAYGNATTDIYGFEQAGIDKASTFILGKHGGESGTVALGEDYLQHLQDIAAEPPATQPFDG